MNLKKILALVLALAMVLGTMSFSVTAEEDFGYIDEIIEEVSEIEAEEIELFEVEEKIVAKIGNEGYTSINEAILAAQAAGMTDVTINLVGNPTKAEMTNCDKFAYGKSRRVEYVDHSGVDVSGNQLPLCAGYFHTVKLFWRHWGSFRLRNSGEGFQLFRGYVQSKICGV